LLVASGQVGRSSSIQLVLAAGLQYYWSGAECSWQWHLLWKCDVLPTRALNLDPHSYLVCFSLLVLAAASLACRALGWAGVFSLSSLVSTRLVSSSRYSSVHTSPPQHNHNHDLSTHHITSLRFFSSPTNKLFPSRPLPSACA